MQALDPSSQRSCYRRCCSPTQVLYSLLSFFNLYKGEAHSSSVKKPSTSFTPLNLRPNRKDEISESEIKEMKEHSKRMMEKAGKKAQKVEHDNLRQRGTPYVPTQKELALAAAKTDIKNALEKRRKYHSSLEKIDFSTGTFTFTIVKDDEVVGEIAISRTPQDLEQFSYEELENPQEVENMTCVSSMHSGQDRIDAFILKLPNLKVLDVQQHKLKEETLNQLTESGSLEGLELGKNAIFPKSPLKFSSVTSLYIDVTESSEFNINQLVFERRFNEVYPNLEELHITLVSWTMSDRFGFLKNHKTLKEVNFFDQTAIANRTFERDTITSLNDNQNGIKFELVRQ